ncbi:hypothetical protein NDU88_007253 [Pleurodeles waltl]|uniref:Uncharacterized protein n=1 Tax=Pleurodeles waltl TaxID=8319 RepID=A0AAV7PL43_PLEWA|nr:hypothetical protein NDU88_007253 [Pleurodeles waltl]
MDSPATFRTDPRSEWHPAGPEENRAIENGNLDFRIPINLRVDEREARRLEKANVVRAGNLDIRVPARNSISPVIRVPASFKREEGLCAGRTGEEKDAEEERAEIAGSEDSGRDEKTSDPHFGEKEPENTRETPTEGQDSPEKLELRQVPGGNWLKQVRSCLRYKL